MTIALSVIGESSLRVELDGGETICPECGVAADVGASAEIAVGKGPDVGDGTAVCVAAIAAATVPAMFGAGVGVSVGKGVDVGDGTAVWVAAIAATTVAAMSAGAAGVSVGKGVNVGVGMAVWVAAIAATTVAAMSSGGADVSLGEDMGDRPSDAQAAANSRAKARAGRPRYLAADTVRIRDHSRKEKTTAVSQSPLIASAGDSDVIRLPIPPHQSANSGSAP